MTRRPRERRFAWAVSLAVCAAAGGCAVPPWSMGHPLDGKPSVPPTTQAPSLPVLHATARAERSAGHPALELRALSAIATAQRLTGDERDRLVVLLEQRATELRALGRAAPASVDLRRIEELAPARARTLADLHAQAERDAGDAWLAVGDRRRARDAYQRAATLGARSVDFRLVAARDGEQPAPPDLTRPDLERAILDLPLRAVPVFAEAYLALPAGEQRRVVLARARQAAHQEGRRALVARIDATPTAAADGAPLDALLDAPAVPSGSRPPTDDARLGDWVVGAASVSFRLVALLAARRDLLVPGDRSRAWANLLLDEDPSAPDVLALTAVIDGLAGRVGGAERKLTDLIYFTPDRYQGMVRAAGIWEGVGQARLACATWLRAARWRDEADDPAWRRAVACTRRDPDAGDWRAITAYVLQRAPADRRDAIAATLDPGSRPAPALLDGAVNDRRAGEPIPCDTGGSPR